MKRERYTIEELGRTNKALARRMNCTPRQISKSRRRGWIWVNDEKVKYKAPRPFKGLIRYTD